MRLTRVLLGILALGIVSVSAPAQEPYDDCAAGFIAFIGLNAYQFSPLLAGELGQVRLFTILSNQGAAAGADFGRAFWRMEIRGPEASDELVRGKNGTVRIDERGAALAEFFWDGRNDAGQLANPGKYRYTFYARYLPDRLFPVKDAHRYEDLVGFREAEEAYASTGEVIVDYGLDAARSRTIRTSLLMASCQTQENGPIEMTFPYNFYYGSTHSHSRFSDGGQMTSDCRSGPPYGRGNFNPSDIYTFARTTARMDYWVVNEHNHLIDDSVANNNPPLNEVRVHQRYQDGLAAATAATVSGTFVALYGMEWGVLTNSNQGHVTLLETPLLFGWETCTNCTGSSPECTAGTDCYFDLYTPKRSPTGLRTAYPNLYLQSVQNPSPVGALGILCHPGPSHFDNYEFNDNALDALQGIAVRSGLAFATSVDCLDTNVGATDYFPRWRVALEKGFRLGPTADHDAHCNNYAIANPTRTVYLLPNSSTPVLTKTALMQAHKARHFYASEDSNAQLVFATDDNSQIMGDAFSVGTSVTLRAAVYDPNEEESVSSIELWRGQVGGTAVPYVTVSNQSALTVTEIICGGTYFYFILAVQADGHKLWSSPMWITFTGGASCGADVSGWRVNQQNSLRNYWMAPGTTIPYNGYIVIARNATKTAFQNFWLEEASLPSNVLYINSGGAFPQINGGEYYNLYDASETLVDGRTISMNASGGKSIQRVDPCRDSDTPGSWTVSSWTLGTPGSGAGPGCGRGVVINEFTDPLGTGNFNFEFIELHYDD